MRRVGGWVLGLSLVVAAGAALAGEGRVTVRLKDGQEIAGQLLGFGERTFRIQVGDQVQEIRESEVARIEFAEEPGGAATGETDSPDPRPDSPEAAHRPVHEAPVDLVANVDHPGQVALSWNPSVNNEFVITNYEVQRQLEGQRWEVVTDLVWGQEWWDMEVGVPVRRRYRVASLARIDQENPVVARFGLELPADQARREATTDWVTPRSRFVLTPITIMDEGRVFLRIEAFDGERWHQATTVVRLGEEIGQDARSGEVDFRTGLTLTSARREQRQDPRWRFPRQVQVLSTRWPDGTEQEWSDDAVGARGVGRLEIVDAPARPAKDRIVAALGDVETRIDLPFGQETVWVDVLVYLRQATQLNVVTDPSFDPAERSVRASLRQARQREALQLLFELGGLDAVPYCEVLYLHPKDQSPAWLPPRQALDSAVGQRLQALVVSVDWVRLPLDTALELLGRVSDSNVVLTPRAIGLLEDEGLVVDLRLEAVQLVNVLTLAVRRHPDLAWTVRHGAVLVHTTAEEWVASASVVSDDEHRAQKPLPREDTLRALEEATAELARSPDDRAALLKRAKLLGSLRRHEEAEADFTRVLEEEPGSTQALRGRAACRRDLGNLRGASEDAQRYVELRPDSFRAKLLLSRIQAQQGRVAVARVTLSAAMQIAPDEAEVWLAQAQVAMVALDFVLAEQSLEQARRLDPALPGVFLAEGQLKLAVADISGAIRLFEAEMELAPTSAEAWAMRGYARQALRDLDGARADYAHALSLDPGDPRAWLGRGALRREAGDLEGARADLIASVQLDRTHVDAWVQLGVVALDLGQTEEAAEAFSRALALEPARAELWGGRGVALARLKRFEEALQALTRAIELDPSDARAFHTRGRVHFERGDQEAGLADLRRCLALLPEGDPRADDLAEEIESKRSRPR